jgi:hypothetical protein
MASVCFENQLQQLEDIREIETFIAKYAYLHTAGMYIETAALSTRDIPGGRVEISPLGRWDGPQGMNKMMYFIFWRAIYGTI